MDLLEHLITVLRTALDYVGVDFDDLPQPEWLERRAELSTRYRSLVRLIARLLPAKPARRLRLQPTLIGHSDRYGGSLDSLLASFSDDPMADPDLDLTSEDIVWVEEDLGDNCIQLRAQVREDVKPKHGRVEEMDKGLFVLRNLPDLKTSTPLNQSLSVLSQTNPVAMMKISALEDELTKLRLQIAQIVVAQENATFQKSAFITDGVSVVRDDEENEELDGRDSPCGTEELDGGDSPDGTDDVFPPPPASFSRDESLADKSFPPPPTPPPLTPDLSAAATPPSPPPPPCRPTHLPTMETGTPDVPGVVQHVKAAHKPVEEEITPAGPPPSLTDVLRGLGSVKLRSIQRSPGGTPIRCAPKQVPHSDPTFLIAQALKKKFAFRNLHDSPETDKENEFSSPDATPKTTNVPMMLRKKIPRRRSSLCTDSTDLIGPSTAPLKDRNIRV